MRKFVFEVVRWIPLGLALGLRESTLEKIRIRNRDDVDLCMKDTLAAWLRMEDMVAGRGGPSWKALVQALYSPSVNYREIANTIAVSHRLPG